MSTKNASIAVLAIIALSVVIGIYLYPQFPETVTSHWNSMGNPDGTISKFWGLFLMPIISLVLFLLFIFVPKIDPKKQNIDLFRGHYNNFIVGIMAFLFYIYILSIFYNLGYYFNIVQFLSPAFALLFFYAGVLISRAKRNWFIGIRTPWTLESDSVWDKTHELGSKLFKAVAALSLLGVVFPLAAIYLILIPIIASALYLIVFSYLEYKKEISGK